MHTSPAQIFMSRRTKTVLPTKETLLCPQVPNPDEQQHKLQKEQEAQARYYNRSAMDLPKLKTRDKVKVKPTKTSTKIWQKATVVRKIDDRSYIVETLEEQHIAVIDIISERRQSHLRRQNQSNKLN